MRSELVTVVGFVILSVKQDLTSGMSNRGINEPVSLAYECEKICGFFCSWVMA